MTTLPEQKSQAITRRIHQAGCQTVVIDECRMVPAIARLAIVICVPWHPRSATLAAISRYRSHALLHVDIDCYQSEVETKALIRQTRTLAMNAPDRSALLARSWTQIAKKYDTELATRFHPWIAQLIASIAAHTLPPGPLLAPACGPGLPTS